MITTGQFLSLKDLAQRLQLHPRTVKRWWKRLGVPPTVPAHACNRWSEQDAEKLARKWARYWKNRNRKN